MDWNPKFMNQDNEYRCVERLFGKECAETLKKANELKENEIFENPMRKYKGFPDYKKMFGLKNYDASKNVFVLSNRNSIQEPCENKDTYDDNEALVSKDFFSENITINASGIFPMVVVATMSSGKSTLINALLGQQILPSRNEACTAKIYSILDDDKPGRTKIFVTYKNGETVVKDEDIVMELEKANNDNDVTDILIRGHVKGVLNTDKALLIVDTPGPNNSRDVSHKQVMLDVLKKINGGLILYVLNATQPEINDDKYLLGTIREYMKENPKISVLFVINKVDQLDEEKGESVGQHVIEAKEYLLKNGIVCPQIIPVSALAASLFQKVLSNEKLTTKEYRLFCAYYDMYKPHDFNMRSFAITSTFPRQYESVEVNGKIYAVGALNRAIDNTGIKLLEEEIQKAQILSSRK